MEKKGWILVILFIIIFGILFWNTYNLNKISNDLTFTKDYIENEGKNCQFKRILSNDDFSRADLNRDNTVSANELCTSQNLICKFSADIFTNVELYRDIKFELGGINSYVSYLPGGIIMDIDSCNRNSNSPLFKDTDSVQTFGAFCCQEIGK